MTYTVFYKRVNSVFWKKLKKVKGDGLLDESTGYADTNGFQSKTTNNSRWFILEDETRIEIPVNNVMFKFSKERFMSIKQNVERETGQRV
jgi:hypothetical protein